MNKSLHKLYFLAILLMMDFEGYSQATLSITQAQEMAIERSPLQRQKLYLETSAQLNSKSYRSINYPQLLLNAQASYQSDVFSLPFTVPGIDSPIIPQDQFKVGIDFYQNIYNGGASRAATQIEDSKLQSDLQTLEVSFQQIREVINSLFFGVLKAQEQINLIDNVQKDLNNQKDILQAAVDQGAALPVSVKMLEKEIISMDQKLIELQSSRVALIEMLEKWIEQPLGQDVILTFPETEITPDEMIIDRPESRQFDLQAGLLESRKSQLTASRIPDIGLFGTAGLGYPNPLNFFEVEVAPYWLAGIKMSWRILDYGKSSRDKEVLDLQQQSLNAAKQNFEKSIDINMTMKIADIEKYRDLIEKDREIVRLQDEIVSVSSSQLQNGVINSNDYITEVNKGLNASISLRLHEIDLERTKIELITLTGNSEKYEGNE